MREKQGALDSGTKGTDAGEGTRLTTGMKRKSTLLNAETHTLHLFLPENEKPSSVSDDSSLGIQASPIESIQTLAVRIPPPVKWPRSVFLHQSPTQTHRASHVCVRALLVTSSQRQNHQRVKKELRRNRDISRSRGEKNYYLCI